MTGPTHTMLKSKIHRATVTQADLHYVGTGSDPASVAVGARAEGLVPGDVVTVGR